MNIMNFCRNQRGTTLVEMMMSVLILSGISYGVLAGMDAYSSRLGQTRSLQQRDKRIHALLETIRTNLGQYQLSYDNNEANADIFLDPAKLPLGWSMNQLAPVAECSKCPGRLGYLVHPLDGLPGMFRVVVRVTNPELFPGFKDYEFVVNPK